MANHEHKYYKQTRGSAYMKTFSNAIRILILDLFLVAGIGVMALIISLVWNTVATTVFELPCITYWQAYLFYLLTYMLLFNQKPRYVANPFKEAVR